MTTSSALDAPCVPSEAGARPWLGRLVVPGAMAVAGVVIGLLWAWWSPPGPAGEFLSGGVEPDSTESFIAGDGRFLVLTAAAGVVAAAVAWRRVGQRDVLGLLGLALGGLAGAALTWLLGHLTGGGDGHGTVFTLDDGSRHRISKHLPLDLHAHGLLFAEAAAAVLVYGLFVAFTVRDDLGHPDPVWEQRRVRPDSVDPGHQAQGGWGDGDAAGAAQQRDLAP